jgi:hypothetical protein
MIMLKDVQTLGELCLAAARRYKTRKALELCRGDRLLETVNFRTLAFRSLQLAGLFRGLGIRRGDRIMILAENCPQWPMAAFGAALAGAAFLPADPRTPAGEAAYFRDLGEQAAVKALCVTGGTEKLAAGLDAPRIYLDQFPADRGGILVSLGGVSKRLPLGGPSQAGIWRAAAAAGKIETAGPDDPAAFWPGGGENSHRELLSLATGRPPRLFPRDRIVTLSSLAEKGVLILGVLAAVLGGASLSLIGAEEASGTIPREGDGGLPQTGDLRRIMDLLRPSVLIGEAAFLEALYRGRAAALAEGPLARIAVTRPLARYLGGRGIMKDLGGNLRFLGFTGGPGPELEKALDYARLPRAALEALWENSSKTGDFIKADC